MQMFINDTAGGLNMREAYPLQFYVNGAERMRIDSSGNVGIGTSILNGTLLVISQNVEDAPSSSGNMNTGSFLGAVGVGGAALNIGHDADGTWYNSAYFNNAGVARIHRWLTGGTERMRINSSGNVGIGTASPVNKLSVESTGGASSEIDISLVSGISNKECILNFGKNLATADRYLGRIFYQVDNNVMGFWTNNAERMRIGSTGNVGIGTSSPAKQFEITKASRALIGTLTDGATITPDFDANQNFTVTLGGNRTLANPTNVDAGQTGSIFVVQDATGGRTLSFGSYWKFAGGTAPTLSTGTNAVDRIDYIVKSSTEIHAVATLNLS
jgi:hypothetical protein